MLGSVDPGAAAILLMPLAGVAIATRTLDNRIKRYRAGDRAAAAAVSGFLGDMMSAATTVKVNGADGAGWTACACWSMPAAEPPSATESRQRSAGLRARCCRYRARVRVAGDRRGHGGRHVRCRQAGRVHRVPRLAELPAAHGRPSAWLGASRPAPRSTASAAWSPMAMCGNIVHPACCRSVGREQRPRIIAVRPERATLQLAQSTRTHCRVLHRRRCQDVSFTVPRGSFTVLTGPIGSGKSTRCGRCWASLAAPPYRSRVLWNGNEVADRAAFFVPPNAAYLPQVPQLISDSVADNITLGDLPASELVRALELAAVRADIDEMPDGSATLIGPRGLRLSGGQRQRVATARAVVPSPELVVLDDLSTRST